MDSQAISGNANIDWNDSLFERAELWPVHLTFLTASGLTLWGPGRIEGGPDHVLISSRNLVLAASEPALRAFIARNGSVMDGLPGYQYLRQRIDEGTVLLEPELAFDYRVVAQALNWSLDRWDRQEVATFVSALNLLGDIADGLQDAELVALFDTPEYLNALERLTFVDDSEVAEVITALDRPFFRQLIGMSIQHVDRQTVRV